MTQQNELSKPIYWTGRQWAVTAYGLERIDQPYHYEKERLGWVNHDGSDFGVPDHITKKVWCDVEDFVEAFRQAVRVHAKHFPVVPDGWEANLESLIGKRAAERERSAKIRQHLPKRTLGIISYGDWERAERKAFPDEKHSD